MVSKDYMSARMKKGVNLALLPGGFEEASLYKRNAFRVYIKNRTGELHSGTGRVRAGTRVREIVEVLGFRGSATLPSFTSSEVHLPRPLQHPRLNRLCCHGRISVGVP